MCKLSLYNEHFNIRLVRGVKAWKRSKQRFVELYLLTNNPFSLARLIVTNLISTAKCEPRDQYESVPSTIYWRIPIGIHSSTFSDDLVIQVPRTRYVFFNCPQKVCSLEIAIFDQFSSFCTNLLFCGSLNQFFDHKNPITSTLNLVWLVVGGGRSLQCCWPQGVIFEKLHFFPHDKSEQQL